MSERKLPSSAVFVLSLILPKGSLGRLVCQINHWLSESGPEWTVKRLKAIWAASIQLRAGNSDVVVDIYRNNSISYERSSLLVRGPFKVLMYNFVHAQKPQLIKRWAAGLRIYTCIRLSRLSFAQFQKAREAITGASKSSSEVLVSVSATLRKVAEKYARSLEICVPEPNLGRLKAFTSSHRNIRADRDRPYAMLAASLCSSIRVPASLHDDSRGEDVGMFHWSLSEAGVEDTVHGHISFLQEGGCKARVIAVPNAWVQYYLEPLHTALDRAIQKLPQSAVHDQNKGGYFLNRNQNSELYCFDLSSATDRFPLEIQLAVLEGLGLEDWVEPFEELCEDWKVSCEFDNSNWTYSVGQPMGMYGSFPLFHLTHYLLMEALVVSLKQKGLTVTNESFMVLGDDIIISHPVLASVYRRTMMSLGVELSDSKSITSDRASEFAGFLHVKTNRQYVTFRPYKHSGSAESRAINTVASIGKPVTKASAKWKEFYRLYSPTAGQRHYDLSPLVSGDRDGGLATSGLDVHLLMAYFQQFYSTALQAEDENYAFSSMDDDAEMLENASYQFLLQELKSQSYGETVSFTPPPDKAEEMEHVPVFTDDSLIKEQRKVLRWSNAFSSQDEDELM